MKKPSLNHRYRLIWSRLQHAWVAVAEHIKSDGKNATTIRDNNQAVSSFQSSAALALTKKTQLALVVVSALLGASQTVYAQWTDLAFQAGQATTQQVGNNLTINVTTSRVAATASSLDIAANENVNVFFELGGGTGLFRSTGNSATSIYGGLSSNGNLFLINQNGVLFGQSAQVDVSGLVASSMNISNADFQKGNYQFNINGHSSGVTNQGVIKVSDGGYLVLLGKEVNNSGTLVANNGSVVMASADSAVLDFYGNGLVKANLSGDALEAVVAQSGIIQADGGSVQLATNSRSSAVNVSGLVQANSLVERNGVIRLEGGDHAKVAVSGTLSARGSAAGTTGGKVEVTGEQVALFKSANLDASGDAGGGAVLVGGDYQGKNNAVYNARTAYVDQSASINVDANQTGNGGKAIVWADQTTRYYGNISAKGGIESGNGGFVEVSGKQVLDFIGGVDVSAAKGLGGTVLLDPEYIVLNTTTQTPPANNADGTPDVAYGDAPLAGTTTIQINDVRGFSELFLQASKDITVANNLYMQTNNSIVFEAGRDINVNAAVRTYGTGSINLTAANNINVNGAISTYGAGNIDLTASNNISVNANVTNYGTGAIGLAANADNVGTGDLSLNRRVFARQGDITLSGVNINSVSAGRIQTQGLVSQDSGNVYIDATNNINLAGAIVTTGRNGLAGIDGATAGVVQINAAGAVSTQNISSYGGRGGAGNTAGGNAGAISITSTGVGDITTGNLNSRNGAAKGTGAGGVAGSINVTNTSGNISTKNLYTHGNVDGDGGNISLTAAGDVLVTGRIYTSGGAVATGNSFSGSHAGNVTISSVNNTITSTIYANGGNARGADEAGGNAGVVSITGSGAVNTATIYSRTGAATGMGAGGNAGSITLSGSSITSTGSIYTIGNRNGDGGNISLSATSGDITTTTVYANGGSANAGTAGNDAGTITINASGAVNTTNVYANGGHGGAGNTSGGNAGVINIASTASGNITTAHISARTGAARGTGIGGSVGSINVTNTSGNINTTNLYTYGNTNGDGGNVTVSAAAGDVTVTGRVYTYGGGIASGHTLAGRSGGNVNISGVNRTITSRINANGNTARGINQAGGNAGTISITGSGALNTKDIYSRTGAATGMGAGGDAGSITLSGSSITSTGTIYTIGNRNGDGGNISLTSTGGDITTTTVYANGGSANAGTAGNDAGTITINAASAVSTTNVYANGSAGRGIDQAGGHGGVIDINATGAITTAAMNASGGTGGNGAGSNASGGNAGAIDVRSTGAGAITVTNSLSMHSGYARGSGNGGNAGAITIKNDNGGITTKNIYAEGYNHGNGSNISLDAENAGDVTVNGQIRTYGDVNASSTRAGTNAGNVTIKGINTTVASTINVNGGRGRGANQAGGHAGSIVIAAAGSITINAIAASGGNGGAGAGSNADGGDAGSINMQSTGAGDVTTTNITARTGYARGSGTGNAGLVNIGNTNGSLTTGNINTRGQRKGAGGDVSAVTTGGDISVGTVDARASNIPATNGGDVTIATTTGDATVTNILTGGRWLVYSGDPRNDTIGASLKASADFKQYNTNYGGTLSDAGNGFVYRHAPIITTSLSGTANKAYDGNTAASIVGLTLNQTGGAIDGDVINISALTSATYDNKNVGTGKTVTSNALAVTSGSNGTTTVYGYQVNAGIGNVGAITPSALSKAENAGALNPRNSAGLGTLLDTAEQPQQFIAVFDVDATAAGGDVNTEACETNVDEKLKNPNTTLMLNFGVNLPEGVNKDCV